jgi:hypothetical protein
MGRVQSNIFKQRLVVEKHSEYFYFIFGLFNNAVSRSRYIV